MGVRKRDDLLDFYSEKQESKGIEEDICCMDNVLMCNSK